MNKLLLTTAAMLALAGTAMAAGSYDGIYNGTRTTKPTRAGVTSCTPVDNAATTVTVANNHFDVKVGNDTHGIDIAADGSFKGSMTFRTSSQGSIGVYQISYSGQITNGDFQMDRGNEYCATHISLRKS